MLRESQYIGSTFEDFLSKMALFKNIVYLVRLVIFAQYRVHIALILKKNIAQAWSLPLGVKPKSSSSRVPILPAGRVSIQEGSLSSSRGPAQAPSPLANSTWYRVIFVHWYPPKNLAVCTVWNLKINPQIIDIVVMWAKANAPPNHLWVGHTAWRDEAEWRRQEGRSQAGLDGR